MKTSPERNVRAAENIFWLSMEKTVNFWSARTGNATIGRHFPITTNAAVPTATKLEMIVKSEEETFICSTCGYKEKLSAFKNAGKEGAGVNKREVARYLNQQKKEAEEPLNNAFAALSG